MRPVLMKTKSIDMLVQLEHLVVFCIYKVNSALNIRETSGENPFNQTFKNLVITHRWEKVSSICSEFILTIE